MLRSNIGGGRTPVNAETRKRSEQPAPGQARRCAFYAKALYTTKGCRNIQEFQVEVIEISSTQLRLRSTLSAFLPENFALIIGARQYGIGCSIIGRSNDIVTCNLIRRENVSMIAFLTSIRNPAETLLEIRNPLFPKSCMQT